MKQYEIKLYPVNWLLLRFLLCRTASFTVPSKLLSEGLLIASPLSVFAILCIDHKTGFCISYTLWAVHSNLFHVLGNYRCHINSSKYITIIFFNLGKYPKLCFNSSMIMDLWDFAQSVMEDFKFEIGIWEKVMDWHIKNMRNLNKMNVHNLNCNTWSYINRKCLYN